MDPATDSSPPKVFISATSGDLKSVRQIVKEALLTINCHPVEQTNFEPDWRTVSGMLEDKITGCQALIHIAGLRYGAEPDPATLPPGTPRRSYTQMEYEIGCRLHDERGDEGFRVYTFVCPDDFPYDTGADPEPEEKVALQREHRARLIDSPFLYDRPATADSLQARILALQEQVLAIRREQAAVRREVIANRRIGIKAFAILLLALCLIGGGLWWVNHRQDTLIAAQRMDAPALRARLAEASERTLQDDLAAAAKETRWTERQRLTEAAQSEHQSRLARIDDLANRLAELSADSESSPVLLEMTRILETDGVDAALAYIETQRADVLAEVRAVRGAERQRIRTKLEPLLQAAGIQRTKGLNDEARAAYRELIELEPEWPEALFSYAYFLYDRTIYAESYDTLATALADAEENHQLAMKLVIAFPENLWYQRLLSVSYGRLGQIAFNRGSRDVAEKHFVNSFKISETLATTVPENLEWQRDLSISLEKLGEIALAHGDLLLAKERFSESFAICNFLAETDETNVNWQHDLSVALSKLGEVALAQGNAEEAEEKFLHSLTIMNRLTAAVPENTILLREYSMALKVLGDAAFKEGNIPYAEERYFECLRIASRRISEDPDNLIWRRDLAAAHILLAEIALFQNDFPSAERRSSEAHTILLEITSSDPSNADSQHDLSVLLRLLGDLTVAQGDLPGAVRRYTECHAILERLAASDSANAAWQRDLSVSLNKLGDLAVAQGDGAGASRRYTESLAIAERLAASDPANAEWQRDLAMSHFKLFSVAQENGDSAAAVAALRACFTVLEGMKQRGMHLDSQSAQLHEKLAEVFGGGDGE
ncbi:MAG: DUF4062 domain-containing protein [Verrucomicrobiales bacterium]|nr:DUF4062 domain-containing protein [Verrucomicrobiales bacterium]